MLQVLAFPPDQIWENTPTLFLFMMVEATITLMLVIFFLRMGGESLRSLGGRGTGPDQGSCVLVWRLCPYSLDSTFLVGAFFHVFLPEQVSKSNPLLELVQSETDLALFLNQQPLRGRNQGRNPAGVLCSGASNDFWVAYRRG